MEFLRFCAVGTLGFVADSSITLMMTQALGLGPTVGRIVAFVTAATLTWQLNRRYTFRSSAGRASWVPYVVLTSVGALINIGAYRVWIGLAGTSPAQIILGIALGSVAALTFNYFVSRQFVFFRR